ncbi:GLPGLI family protein [Chryseobacterium contaminans]|uniref:GLPGLI family protein n=1 Tax=Chryseobacterium contaminans TaxID=1423959 RepID=A0A1M7HKT2_9FLAO|nr:GLPGLI family protein [Chryseobacterium contaminans]SHM29105.1 GLPGLI family protein [Chryseobacterium contaminans]
MLTKKKRVLLSFIFFFSFSICIFSQEFTYERVSTRLDSSKVVYHEILTVSKDFSVYTKLGAKDTLNLKKQENIKEIYSPLHQGDEKLYKDFTKGKLYIDFSKENTIIEDSLNIIPWKLENEYKEILGYKAQKATAEFRKNVWTVWFTKDLPYFDGPWKLNSLPGLILEANSMEGHLAYKIVKIANISPSLLEKEKTELKDKLNKKKAISAQENAVLEKKKRSEIIAYLRVRQDQVQQSVPVDQKDEKAAGMKLFNKKMEDEKKIKSKNKKLVIESFE